jgi:hypothetical protein
MDTEDLFNSLKKLLINDRDTIVDNEDINYLHELYKTRVKEANEITDLYIKLSESIRDRLTTLRHKYDVKSEEREEEKEDDPVEKKKVKKLTKKEREKKEKEEKEEKEPTENIIDTIEKEEEPKKKLTKKETEVPKKKGRKKKDEE